MKTSSLLILVIATVILGGFYWYEYRPAKIRNLCNAKAVNIATELAQQTREERERLYGKRLNDPLFIPDGFSPDDVFNKTYIESYSKCMRDNGLKE